MNAKPTFTMANFEVLELLGRGGMSSVWKARQLSLDRMVAIKILSSKFSEESDDLERFRMEARAAARLKHPNIVQVYDANFKDGIYYFVMELVDGYTMGELQRRKGKTSEGDALIIAEAVAVALDYAWGGFEMVHNDIKPDNIMVDEDGSLKVTDLGLCRSLALLKTEKDDSEEILGTPAYMSPEQVYGSPDVDCRSDIYELGATLYHLVTGHMLFEGINPDEIAESHANESQAVDPRHYTPEISNAFVLLLEKMVAKDRKHRHHDWKALLHDINKLRDGYSPVLSLIPSKGSSIKRWVSWKSE
ncbi:MAG: serine/threonine-protein kinase [Kiritimatiellae bacterium]|jgi:serine/threonine protein kinase|nr:serine/threonine-protein kinase [Kiritimatiellia bacterium]